MKRIGWAAVAVVGLVVVLAVVIARAREDWSANRFEGRLACGLTMEEFAEIVSEHDLSVDRVDGAVEVWHAGISWKLWFEDGVLQSVSQSYDYGFKQTMIGPRLNVCTGARSALINLDLGKDVQGATLRVDGSDYGQVGDFHAFYLPAGKHELLLRRSGRTFRRVITVTPEDGYIRFSVTAVHEIPVSDGG